MHRSSPLGKWLGLLACLLLGLSRINEETLRDFPGGPVVKTLRFQGRGCRFYPWLGN